MGIFNKKITNRDNTENDLKGIAVLNTKSKNGIVAGNPKDHNPLFEDPTTLRQPPKVSFRTTTDITQNVKTSENLINNFFNATKNNQLIQLLTTWHKNWNLGKFIYSEDEDFDFLWMEDQAFMLGSLGIFKDPEGKPFIAGFEVVDYDLRMNPLSVKLILPEAYKGSFKGKDKYFVNKDCVLFRPTYDGLWTQPWTYGKLFKYWSLYEDIVEIYQELKNNFKLTRERLALLGVSQDDATFNQLNEQLLNGSPLIALDKNSLTTQVLKGNIADGSLIQFSDRSSELQAQFKFATDLLKSLDGGRINASNYKKQEVSVSEATSEDQFNGAINCTELYLRQQFIKNFNKVFGKTIEVISKIEEEKEEAKEEAEKMNPEEYQNEK